MKGQIYIFSLMAVRYIILNRYYPNGWPPNYTRFRPLGSSRTKFLQISTKESNGNYVQGVCAEITPQ